MSRTIRFPMWHRPPAAAIQLAYDDKMDSSCAVFACKRVAASSSGRSIPAASARFRASIYRAE